MYPQVLSEESTLERVLSGQSIARFGDGELKLMMGRPCVSQAPDVGLADEMANIIGGKTKALVGIPTLDSRCPKLLNWQKLAPKFENFTDDEKIYGSAFISRPDSAPWINTPKFFDMIQSLWMRRRVTFVGNGQRSLTKEFLLNTGAKKVDWIVSPYRDAYSKISQLQQQIIDTDNDRVILCVGPTATCLAERLAQAGLHAIDLGHIGMFWRAYEKGRHTFIEQREINAITNKVEPNL